jgi:mRNA interferase MazF
VSDDLDYISMKGIDMEKRIRRGDIYYADLSPIIGSEQGGVRPVVVIQNNIGNRYSPTVVVAAITSKSSRKTELPTHIRLRPDFGLDKDSVVLLEQIRTIDRKRLYVNIGCLNREVMTQIDKALAISIGLIDFQHSNNDEKKESSENDNEEIVYESGKPVEVMELCLCSKCVSQFYDVYEQRLQRVDYNQRIKELCDYCSSRNGFDYIITSDVKSEKAM